MKRSRASLRRGSPYGEWIKENQITLDSLPEPGRVMETEYDTILCRQRALRLYERRPAFADCADGD